MTTPYVALNSRLVLAFTNIVKMKRTERPAIPFSEAWERASVAEPELLKAIENEIEQARIMLAAGVRPDNWQFDAMRKAADIIADWLQHGLHPAQALEKLKREYPELATLFMASYAENPDWIADALRPFPSHQTQS